MYHVVVVYPMKIKACAQRQQHQLLLTESMLRNIYTGFFEKNAYLQRVVVFILSTNRAFFSHIVNYVRPVLSTQ